MLTTLVLVCAAAIAPADCSKHNAIAVLRQPPAAMCDAVVATALASSGLEIEPGKAYPKIVCSR